MNRHTKSDKKWCVRFSKAFLFLSKEVSNADCKNCSNLQLIYNCLAVISLSEWVHSSSNKKIRMILKYYHSFNYEKLRSLKKHFNNSLKSQSN